MISGRYYVVRWWFPSYIKGIPTQDEHEVKFGIREESFEFTRLLSKAGCVKYVVFDVTYEEKKTSNAKILQASNVDVRWADFEHYDNIL